MWRQEKVREEQNHEILAKLKDSFGAPHQKGPQCAQIVYSLCGLPSCDNSNENEPWLFKVQRLILPSTRLAHWSQF